MDISTSHDNLALNCTIVGALPEVIEIINRRDITMEEFAAIGYFFHCLGDRPIRLRNRADYLLGFRRDEDSRWICLTRSLEIKVCEDIDLLSNFF